MPRAFLLGIRTTMKVFASRIVLAAGLAVGLMLGACENYEPGEVEKTNPKEPDVWDDWENRDTIFGKGGLNLFGDDVAPEGGGSLGVNSYLWRASLDTISFMPVNSADPFGGVIITDWHSTSESPSERFKLNVYILGRTLRADGVRVALFRQVRDAAGGWRDAAVPEGASTQIEDSILTRARQIRSATLVEQEN